MPTARQQLAAFLAKYDPKIGALARAALTCLRRLTPGATELVYDNYNALAIGFAPGERASEAILSIAVYPRNVNLFFLQAVKSRLPDPHKLLRGGGTTVRHIPLENPRTIDQRPVRALIAAALKRAKVSLDPDQKRRIVIRAVAAKQRPRRPAI